MVVCLGVPLFYERYHNSTTDGLLLHEPCSHRWFGSPPEISHANCLDFGNLGSSFVSVQVTLIVWGQVCSYWVNEENL